MSVKRYTFMSKVRVFIRRFIDAYRLGDSVYITKGKYKQRKGTVSSYADKDYYVVRVGSRSPTLHRKQLTPVPLDYEEHAS